MKKTLKGFLHHSTRSWNAGELSLFKCDMTDPDCGVVMIKPLEIEVEIPHDFDPRPQQIAALQEKQKAAAAAFQAFTTDNLRQIQQLQALELTV